MKDFDIDKISKQMPYQAPSEDFFKEFPMQVFNTMDKRKKRVILMQRISIGIAAVFMGAIAVFNFEANTQNSYENVDKFLVELSDEDLTELIAESQFIDEFYTNL